MTQSTAPQPVRPCIDLHFHSIYSNDAFGVPGEYVAFAEARGVAAIAPAEHDNVDSLPRYREAIEAQGAPLALYAGVEIDVTAPAWGHFHLLAYFFDPGHEGLRAVLDAEVAGGMRVLEAEVRAMNEDGHDVDLDAAIALARRGVPDRAVGPKAVWQWLHATGRQPSFDAAKQAYLAYANGLPDRHVPVAFEKALRVVHDAGGIAVLAHPGAAFGEEDVERILRLGVDGVEVYARGNGDRVRAWEAIARRRGWAMTGGSDHHQDTGPDFAAWPTLAPAELLEPLFEAHEKRHARAPRALHPGAGAR